MNLTRFRVSNNACEISAQIYDQEAEKSSKNDQQKVPQKSKNDQQKNQKQVEVEQPIWINEESS